MIKDGEANSSVSWTKRLVCNSSCPSRECVSAHQKAHLGGSQSNTFWRYGTSWKCGGKCKKWMPIEEKQTHECELIEYKNCEKFYDNDSVHRCYITPLEKYQRCK